MLTMEDAAAAIFSPKPIPAALHPFISRAAAGESSLLPDPKNEGNRLRLLGYAAKALGRMEDLGLSCGVFGSALRPGDFFYNSDIDLAAWLPGQEPISRDLALMARFACHDCLFGSPFDLVLLPCANQAFGERILNGWSRGRSDVELASMGRPMSKPLIFGPQDVAFIDHDRLQIALAAAERVAKAATESGSNPSQRAVLSICSSIQTIVRVAEKCAKDALREFAKIKPPMGTVRPLYPLLAYPSASLGGVALASEQAVALYFECGRRATPPTAPSAEWARETALLAMLFSRQLHDDFQPGLEAMRQLDSRALASPAPTPEPPALGVRPGRSAIGG